MKKIIASFLAALLLINFAACGSSSEEETSGSRPSQTSASTASSDEPEVSTGTTTDPTAPATTGTESILPPSTPVPPTSAPPASEPASYVPVEGRENLWDFCLDDEKFIESSYVEIGAIHGDRLLLTTCDYLVDENQVDEFGEEFWAVDYLVYLIDLNTGRICGRYEAGDSLFEAGFLDDGSVYILNFTDNSDFFGYDLHHFTDFPQGRQSLTDIEYDRYCGISGDGTVWLLEPEEALLRARTPFDDRLESAYSCPEWSSANYFGTFDGIAYFAGYGRVGTTSLVGIRLTDGERFEYPHLRNAERVNGSLLSIDSSEEWLIALPSDFYAVNAFTKQHVGSYISTAAGSRFTEYVYDWDGEVFGSYGVYDGANGNELGRIFEAEDLTGLSAICMDDRGNLILSCYDEEGRIRVLLWKYDAGETKASESFRVIDVRTQGDECGRLADEIYARHGIRVFYDELSLIDLVWDYTCEYIDDSYTISMALNELAAALDKYPAGMFSEMLTDNYDALEIYLCGTFTPTDGTGISTAVALTNTRYGAFIMAFNVRYMSMMEQNLAHELMHVMEHRLAIYSDEAGISYLDEWAALNPAKFSYYDSYHDKNGNEINDTTYTTWRDPDTAWFVDPYSKSFATEDRARVFEYLFIGSEWTLHSPHLQAKAEYLCALIRAAFPSVGQTDRVAWEIF